MKTIACLFFLFMAVIGCSSDKADLERHDTQPTTASADYEQLFTEAARNLVKQFSTELQSTLLGAINENGAAYAFQMCQLKAPEIASAHSVAGWTVKRVSTQWRNIAGRADSTEKAMLERFAEPSTTSDFLVLTSGPDSARMFHYYEKIIVKDMCLQCHGDIQRVDQDLWKQIRVMYPYDKATGYKSGDLRGMFVVDAPYPGGEDVARLFAQGVSVSQIAAAMPAQQDSSAADSAE
jgi:hypothetical protein